MSRTDVISQLCDAPAEDDGPRERRERRRPVRNGRAERAERRLVEAGVRDYRRGVRR